MVVGLRNKAIDGAMMNEPNISQVAAEGIGLKAADYNDFYPGQQTAALIYSEKFATERRAAAQGFTRAYIKGIRFYFDSLKDGRIAGSNAKEVIDILVNNTGIADRSIYENLAPSGVDPDGRLSTGSLRNDLVMYKDDQLIDDPKMTVEDILDTSFVEDALLKIGEINPRR